MLRALVKCCSKPLCDEIRTVSCSVPVRSVAFRICIIYVRDVARLAIECTPVAAKAHTAVRVFRLPGGGTGSGAAGRARAIGGSSLS